MAKYPIKKEFFPYNHVKFRLSRRTLALAARAMKPPRFLWRDPALRVDTLTIPVGDDVRLDAFAITPRALTAPTPCLVFFHGGGFVLEAASYHYRLAMRYAAGAGCRVILVRYRLAPQYPFPHPFEDCYGALCWLYENAETLGIDRERFGVVGDSAGATLAAASCMMARDRLHPVRPRFQVLLYPYLDRRGGSESSKRFVDTPMWNSRLSDAVGPLFTPDESAGNLVYTSPVEAETLAGMPPAYIETAEFDPLHDDGILYARLLGDTGIPVELHETKGTMHGFDIAQNAPTTREMVEKRVEFMKKWFT